MNTADPFSPNMATVARAVLGAENLSLSSNEELRYGTNGSLSVDLRAGTWFDHEAQEGGGVLDLLRLRAELVNGAAFSWLREHGIDIPNDRATTTKAKWTTRDYAVKLVSEKCPIDAGNNPAAFYLNSRGITKWTDDFGFHPSVAHKTKQKFGGLVCAGRDAAGAVQFAHVVFLKDGKKLVIEPRKQSFGSMDGAAIKLPGTSEPGTIILTEGPEDGLSIWQATGIATWITCGVSNFGKVQLLIIGNHKPVLNNVDDAARRRFNIIPFVHKPTAPDRQLEAKLMAEWPGILRWMIDGCLDWQKNWLVRPDVVKVATASYFSEQDLMATWIDECCETGGRNLSDTTENLFKSWTAFATANGEKVGSAKTFNQILQRHEFEPERFADGPHRNKRGFRRVTVRATDTSGQWHNRDD